MNRTRQQMVKIAAQAASLAGSGPLRLIFLALFGIGLVLAQTGFGDENETAAKAKTAVTLEAGSKSEPKSNSPGKSERPVVDDSVRHHGALGVLLGQSEDGVSVVGVIPGSPAEHAGLRLGDQIRYIDDQRIRTTQELIDTISASKPGVHVELLIRRNGKRQVVEIELAARESTFTSEELAQKDGTSRSAGRVDRQPARGRVPNSYAGAKGMREADQQILILEQRLYRLQQEINDLKARRMAQRPSFDFDAWWERSHHGEADDDPALFQ